MINKVPYSILIHLNLNIKDAMAIWKFLPMEGHKEKIWWAQNLKGDIRLWFG